MPSCHQQNINEAQLEAMLNTAKTTGVQGGMIEKVASILHAGKDTMTSNRGRNNVFPPVHNSCIFELLKIPKVCVGIVIGNRGENIQRIESIHGVRVHIDKMNPPDDNANVDVRIDALEGERIPGARDDILQTCDRTMAMQPTNKAPVGTDKKIIEVPKDCLGKIIGILHFPSHYSYYIDIFSKSVIRYRHRINMILRISLNAFGRFLDCFSTRSKSCFSAIFVFCLSFREPW